MQLSFVYILIRNCSTVFCKQRYDDWVFSYCSLLSNLSDNISWKPSFAWRSIQFFKPIQAVNISVFLSKSKVKANQGFLSRRFKKFKEIQLRSKLSLSLIYSWTFGFKLYLIFHRVVFLKPVYYCLWRIFIVWIGAFRVLSLILR